MEEYYDYMMAQLFIFYCNPTIGLEIAITDKSERFNDVVVQAIVKSHERVVILM